MRIISKLADRMLDLVVPEVTASAESCWEVTCGCINHFKAAKVCCPGSCSACFSTGVAC